MSKWPAVTNCPYFVSKPPSKYTHEGTARHKVLEGIIENWKETGEFEEDPCNDASWAASAIIQTANDLGVERSEVGCEKRVSVKVAGEDIFGTVDAFVFSEGNNVLHVFDFKSFYNCERDYSAQLAGYALGVLSMPEVKERVRDDVSVVCHVLYGDRRIDETREFSMHGIIDLCVTAVKAFSLRGKEGVEPQQCAWCDLCANNAACPAMVAVVDKVGPSIAEATDPTAWQALPVTIRAQLVALADTLSKWASAVKDAAKQDLIDGIDIADEKLGIKYKLQKRSGKRTPRLDDACELLTVSGVDRESLKSAMSISYSGCEKLLRSLGIPKKEAASMLEPVCDIGEESVSIVRG